MLFSNELEKNMLYKMSPALAAHYIDPRKHPPLGIVRGKTNYCWAISLFQMISHGFPIEEIPEKFSKLLGLITSYNNDQKNQKTVFQKTAVVIRDALGFDGDELQQDPKDIFKVFLEKEMIPPLRVECCQIPFNSYKEEIKEEEASCVLPLKNETGKRKVHLKDLLKDYFTPLRNEENIVRKKISFTTPPPHLFLEFTVYKFCPTFKSRIYALILKVHSLVKKRFHLALPKAVYSYVEEEERRIKLIDLKQRVTLEKTVCMEPKGFLTENNYPQTYELDSIIEFICQGEVNHYFSYVKGPDEVWYRCNDDKIKRLSKKIPTTRPSLVHYRRIPRSGIPLSK